MEGARQPALGAHTETGISPSGDSALPGHRYPWQIPEEPPRGPQILHYAETNDGYVHLGQMFNIPDDFDGFTKWYESKARLRDDVFDDVFEAIFYSEDGGRLSVQGRSIYDLDEYERTGRWTKVHELEDRNELPDLVAGKKPIGKPGSEYRIAGVEVPLPLERTDTLNERTGLDKYEKRGEDPFEVAHGLKVANDLLEEERRVRNLPEETDILSAPELLPIFKRADDAPRVVSGAETQRPVPKQDPDAISMRRFNGSRSSQAQGFLRNIWDRMSKSVASSIASKWHRAGRRLAYAKEDLIYAAESRGYTRSQLIKKLGSHSLQGALSPRLTEAQNAWSRTREYFTNEEKGSRYNRNRVIDLGLVGAAIAVAAVVYASNHVADRPAVGVGAVAEATATVKPSSQPSAEVLRPPARRAHASSNTVRKPIRRVLVHKGQDPWKISVQQLRRQGNYNPTNPQIWRYDFSRIMKPNGLDKESARHILPGTKLVIG